MKTIDTYNVEQELFRDVIKLIDNTQKSVAYTINYALTYMYWNIVKRINEEILQYERAEYGTQIIASHQVIKTKKERIGNQEII